MRNIDDALVATGKIPRSELRHIKELPNEEKEAAWRQLVVQGVITEQDVYEGVAKAFGYPFLDAKNLELSADAMLNTISPSFVRRNRIVPIEVDGSDLVVGIDNPENFEVLDEISATTKYAPHIRIITPTALNDLINRYFRTDDEIDKLAESFEQAGGGSEASQDQMEDLTASDDSEPVVRFVSLIIAQAIQDRASDIHVEPGAREITVRYRIDGVLHKFQTADLSIQAGIISRLKVMTDMDIATKRRPQDGRTTVTHGGKKYDIRATSLPSVWGEKIVLRILDNSTDKSTIESIGMSERNHKVFLEAASKSQGMILVTGPTGSGKSTTLYTTLKHIANDSISVVTVEDPVEKRISGITQLQINEKAGNTFSNILKSILRADPDIVFVGEVRDEETAEIAIKASMTGHLVLSTLHTNGAAESISRIVEMGIAPYLVTGSVSCVVAQRLARKLCEECKKPVTDREAKVIRDSGFEFLHEDEIIYLPVGCTSCSNTGYRGRVALTEVMKVDENLDHLIVSGATAVEIRAEAEKHGFLPLRVDGFEKVRKGITSIAEVLRVT